MSMKSYMNRSIRGFMVLILLVGVSSAIHSCQEQEIPAYVNGGR